MTTADYGDWSAVTGTASATPEQLIVERYFSLREPPSDVFEAIMRDYCQAVTDALPAGFSLLSTTRGAQFIGPAGGHDCDIAALVEGIDVESIIQRHWTDAV